MSEPVFVVVGNTNQGKSSIVATLAADESVERGPTPGTTRECREYPLQLNGRTLYKLIDTPGFERPRHALDWMQQRSRGPADRREAVEAFVREFADSGDYRQEVQLLRPIVDGGAIIYVVADGSRPVGAKYEAEMEILQWTSQPRIAVINPINGEDIHRDWHHALRQCFSNIRIFSAHDADFDDRLTLLQALREVNDPWRDQLGEAIDALKKDREECRRQAASIIADMLVDSISYTLERSLPKEANTRDEKERIRREYFDDLRKFEQKARDAIKNLYWHRKLNLQSDTLAAVEGDLVTVASSSGLGLSKRKWELTCMAVGALLGLAGDVASGGSTMGAGTAIGALAGGGVGFLSKFGLKSVKPAFWRAPDGPKLRIGPMPDASFPWLILDRALLTHNAVSTRAHARQDEVSVGQGGAKGLVNEWPVTRRAKFEQQFQRLRGKSLLSFGRTDIDAVREKLIELILPVIGDSAAAAGESGQESTEDSVR